MGGVYISPFPQPHPLPNPLAPHALPVPLTVVPTASPLHPAHLVGDPRPLPSPARTSPATRAPGRLRFSGSGWRRDGGGRAAPVARISPSGRRLPEGQPLNL
ncbi:hypothetical protein ZWY2020_013170 [Hordeum vulgare]|nr:hypothetical protein ZWY2020_013170 [Hordeum vulgare]